MPVYEIESTLLHGISGSSHWQLELRITIGSHGLQAISSSKGWFHWQGESRSLLVPVALRLGLVLYY